MEADVVVDSPANPRVKAVVELRRRRGRGRAGLMAVEGFAELSLALDSGVRPQAVYVAPALVREPAQLALVGRLDRGATQVVECSERAFARLSIREAADGWLGLVPAPAADLAALQVPADALVLVCDGVEKPGNLGAILRTADAAGVDAVIASGPGTDWANPNVVRASKGALFAVPVADADAPAVRAWLAGRGLRIAVATPAATLAYPAADLTGGLALVVGSEHAGLDQAWMDAADLRLRIPMAGRVDSLNVATSAALLVYEALRQRGRL